MPIRFEPSVVLENFLQLENKTTSTLKGFLLANYAPVGSDVLDVVPEVFIFRL